MRKIITVLGASGFIGGRLCQQLRQSGAEHQAPGREEPLTGRHLGEVIYCIGLTSDFRSKPLDTVEAHVCKLLEIVRGCDFDSLLYLSSTRLYDSGLSSAMEEDPFHVAPLVPDNLYNISKAMGESLLLSSGKRVRVARLSNVYGEDFNSTSFLSTIIREALSSKEVTINLSRASERDYVSISDVLKGLIDIATKGRRQIYNIASGTNVSNGGLAEKISELTGARMKFLDEAPFVSTPPISIERMRNEFGFEPAKIMNDLESLIVSYESKREVWDDLSSRG